MRPRPSPRSCATELALSSYARGSIFAGDFEITGEQPLSGEDGSGRGVVYAAYQVSSARRCELEVLHAPLEGDPEVPAGVVVIARGVDEATGHAWIATASERPTAVVAAVVPALTTTQPHVIPPDIATSRLPMLLAFVGLMLLAAGAVYKASGLSLGGAPMPFDEDIDAAPLPQEIPAGPTMPVLPAEIFEDASPPPLFRDASE